jgi:hypothetical protein
MLYTILEWLEATSLAVLIRRSAWFYPVLEIIHITGIVLLVGAAIMFDLRLLGFSRSISVSLLSRHVLPWSRKGLFYLVIPSGLLLFISNASTTGINPLFWLKMLLLLLALLNAIIFHKITFRTVKEWESGTVSDARAKAAAVFSITLWLSVIACGRLLAYY